MVDRLVRMGEGARGASLPAFLFLAAALLAGAAPSRVLAQAASTGVITGAVLDQEDRQPLPNARVGIYRIDAANAEWTMVVGALSDAEGSFRFTVAPGTYRAILSYQSYVPTVRDDIVVTAGGTAEVSVTLVPKPLSVKGVEVKGEQAKATEASTLTERKKAVAVSDILSAQQISKSSDSNAGEALQRVTGLSLVEGKYVFVRGLGERYTNVQMNGASLGTPEPNKRVIPLDLFPSGAFDQISVQKTYTPDQDGEFAGGAIQLETKNFKEGNQFTQSAGTGYAASNGMRAIGYKGGSLDFLGFDDGTRSLPGPFQKLAGDKRIATKGLFGGDGLSREEVQAIGRSFSKTWSPRGESDRPSYSYSATLGRSLSVRGVPVSLLGWASLANGYSLQRRQTNDLRGTAEALYYSYRYDVQEGTESVMGAAFTGISVRPGKEQKISLTGQYYRLTDDVTRVEQGPNFDYGDSLVRRTSLGFVESGVFQSVLSGEHKMPFVDRLAAKWTVSYSSSMRDEPDRRETEYQWNNGQLVLSARRSLPLTRIFGDMNEYDRSGGGHLNKALTLPGERLLTLKAGGSYRDRRRASSYRRLGFKLQPAGRLALDTSLPPESLLVDENIKPGYFELEEGTRENDSYRARQQTRAGYLMGDLALVKNVTLAGGARYEVSEQTVESKSPFVTNARETEALLRTDDLFPALNVTWRASSKMNLRAAFSKTLNRPELRELSPFDMYNYEIGMSEAGNPNLQATTIESYDARWELFPTPGEVFALSLFRKALPRPIESSLQGAGGNKIKSPVNGRDGTLKGFELEARAGLSKLTRRLDRFSGSANYSRVSSKARLRAAIDDAGMPIYTEAPLQGQSSYSLNVGLYYDDGSLLDGALLLGSFGKRLSERGVSGTPGAPLPDVYEYPPLSVDMTLGCKVGRGLRAKLAVENVLERGTEFRQLDKIQRRTDPGRSFSLSISSGKR